MDFRLAFQPKPFTEQINHTDQLLLIGSCFTENIGNKLQQAKFKVLDNPHGILFNPASIVKAVTSYIQDRRYTAQDLFYQNECWNSWDHHSRFSDPDQASCLAGINQSQELAHRFLKKADWLMITLGSAFAYHIAQTVPSDGPATREGEVVANCHKVPTDKFNKVLMSAEEVYGCLFEMLSALKEFNPGIRVIFTISPVRHLRDGFIENNRSKANLIQAVHQLVEKGKGLYYFPAYELVIDDLRDYRFYAEDMVHPNYTATNYVWDKFVPTCIDSSTRELMKEIQQIHSARIHKPFHPASNQHRQFLKTYLEKVKQLKVQYPYLELDDEIKYFNG